MHYPIIALAALALGAQSLPEPAGTGLQLPARDSVIVTGAHGQALVPIRVIAPRNDILDTGGKGTWSGDTLSARTPLILTLRDAASTITVQAIDQHDGVRVTLPGKGPDLETRTGARVLLRGRPDGWSLSSAP